MVLDARNLKNNEIKILKPTNFFKVLFIIYIIICLFGFLMKHFNLKMI
jgi:hypothetical protein